MVTAPGTFGFASPLLGDGVDLASAVHPHVWFGGRWTGYQRPGMIQVHIDLSGGIPASRCLYAPVSTDPERWI